MAKAISILYVNEIVSMLEETYSIDPKLAPMMWGPPGIGKSEAVHQFAEKMKSVHPDFFCLIYITSQMESIDYSMPFVIQGGEFPIYKKIPISDFVFKPDARGIVFFDELPNAAFDVQKATQSIITDRKIGEARIPEGVMIVAAGNYKTDKAGSNGMLSALNNRMEHWYLEPSFEGFFEIGVKRGFHHSVLAYLKMNETNLHNFKPENERNPTPRIWEKVSKYMHHYDSNDSPFIRRRIASLVGDEIANEFMSSLRMLKEFPTLSEIEKRPDTCKLPNQSDIQYALSLFCLNKITKGNRDSIIKYLMRFNLEYQGMIFRQIRQHKPDMLVNNADFTKWAKANIDILTES
jgi:hypothetical protein